MERVGEQRIFSPTDLVGFAGCRHLTQLERAAVDGLVDRPHHHDRGLEALIERGRVHEEQHLASLDASERGVTRIQVDRQAGIAGVERAARLTGEAMRRGDAVIHQATFFADGWRGHADFLERVETASPLGAWSYEPADAKLARHAKPAAVIQLCAYAEQVARLQGRLPDKIHLILGGVGRPRESFRLADFISYYRWLKAGFLAATGAAAGPAANPPAGTYPEPVEQCEVCRWSDKCDQRRRADDHLSLVANIRRSQRDVLVERGVDKVEKLAVLPLPVEPPVKRTSRPGIERVREQARMQVRGRQEGRVVSERLTGVEAGCGLGALPEPTPADLFLDLEGDPFIEDEGMEYLFGIIEPGPSPGAIADLTFHEFWAQDRATEKRAFEKAVDLIRDRRARNPGMHVFHFGQYEVSAFTRLMSRHGTREDEVDEFLRAEVFVDLLRVVRQGIRASVESYSIKKLEPLYGFHRSVPLSEAGDCRADYEAWLELGAAVDLAPGTREKVRLYNRDDCVSTFRLRDWLETERAGAIADGADLPRPALKDGAASEAVAQRSAEVEAAFSRLVAGIPDDKAQRSPAEQARWLLAQLLDWHRRENKSEYRAYKELCGLTTEDLIDEDKAIGGLTYEGIVGRVKQSNIYRFRFPPQSHALRVGKDADDPRTEKSVGEIVAIDEAERTIDIKKGKKAPPPTATALIPHREYFNPDVQRKALLAVGNWVADHGIDGIDAADPYRAACDLLRRHPPRVGQADGSPLSAPGEDLLSVADRLVVALAGPECIVLPIQGPPGSGKTYTASRMIVALARQGKRVGITASSHKVITNLLAGVLEAAGNTPLHSVPMQIADDDNLCPGVTAADSNATVAQALATGATHIVGATVWPWASPDLTGSVDVLFIDEAGQMSLANAIAASQATRSLVLLGDPQQLDQPTKGVHPPGADASALGHVLDGAPTLESTLGLFIEHTWRLHPDICAFTSELYYDGRLESRAELTAQRLNASPPLGGTGIRVVPVAHEGNRNESTEEATEVRRLFDQLLGCDATWFEKGRLVTRALGVADILVMAPYNAQVDLLRRTLPGGARVGTVDKFQGQEAPVVIYSLAASSAEDAPRGMKFLYSPNRLNVATSRAKCVAAVVGSPALFGVGCKTVRQLVLANGFCRLKVAES